MILFFPPHGSNRLIHWPISDWNLKLKNSWRTVDGCEKRWSSFCVWLEEYCSFQRDPWIVDVTNFTNHEWITTPQTRGRPQLWRPLTNSKGHRKSAFRWHHHRFRPSLQLHMRTPTNRTVKVIPFQHSYTTGDTTSSSSSLLRWREKVQRMKMIDWIEVFLPCSRWIRTYNWREYLQPDIVSGITVGIMLVPQVQMSQWDISVTQLV